MSVIAVGNLTTAILWMNFMQDISDDWNEIIAAEEYRNFVYICTETGK